jgi:tetratricopeptide (TPR) repeat protein
MKAIQAKPARANGQPLRTVVLRLLAACRRCQAAIAALIVGTALSSVALSATIGLAQEREALQSQLRQGNFKDLGATLRQLEEEARTGQRSHWDLAQAYDAFRTSDPTITRQLETWIHTDGQNKQARLAHAVHVAHLAGLALGQELRLERQPERVKEMSRLYMQARQDWPIVLNPDGNNPVGLAEVITEAVTNGRDMEAEQFFRHRLADGFDSPLLYRVRARALEPWWSNSSRSWEEALERLGGFIETTKRKFGADPDYAWLNGYYENTRAEMLRRRGQLEEAIAWYDKAIAAGRRAEYFYGRGIAHALKRELDPARADFEQAVSLDADFALAWSQLAGCRRLAGDLDGALSAYNRAVSLDPLNPEFLVVRASVLIRLRRQDGARVDIDAAQAYGATSAWVQEWRGFIYRDIDPAVSRSAYRRARELAETEQRNSSGTGN